LRTSNHPFGVSFPWTLADLYHPPIRGEADVDDDLLQAHTDSLFWPLTITS
jgi:hypothetical protein